jgi:hypothetical protein
MKAISNMRTRASRWFDEGKLEREFVKELREFDARGIVDWGAWVKWQEIEARLTMCAIGLM